MFRTWLSERNQSSARARDRFGRLYLTLIGVYFFPQNAFRLSRFIQWLTFFLNPLRFLFREQLKSLWGRGRGMFFDNTMNVIDRSFYFYLIQGLRCLIYLNSFYLILELLCRTWIQLFWFIPWRDWLCFFFPYASYERKWTKTKNRKIGQKKLIEWCWKNMTWVFFRRFVPVLIQSLFSSFEFLCFWYNFWHDCFCSHYTFYEEKLNEHEYKKFWHKDLNADKGEAFFFSLRFYNQYIFIFISHMWQAFSNNRFESKRHERSTYEDFFVPRVVSLQRRFRQYIKSLLFHTDETCSLSNLQKNILTRKDSNVLKLRQKEFPGFRNQKWNRWESMNAAASMSHYLFLISTSVRASPFRWKAETGHIWWIHMPTISIAMATRSLFHYMVTLPHILTLPFHQAFQPNLPHIVVTLPLHLPLHAPLYPPFDPTLQSSLTYS